jgi:hypothetical protein
MSTPDGHYAPPPLHASLLSLPTEVRLQIYGYLEGITHYHVDDLGPGERTASFAHRRRCRTPDPTYPFLCARPVFCGWYKTEALCHRLGEGEDGENLGLEGAPAGGRWSNNEREALRRTCRVIYEETKSGEEGWIGVTVGHSYDARSIFLSPNMIETDMSELCCGL